MTGKKKLIDISTQPDYWRQMDLFDPSRFTTPITVIGAGSRGSHLAWVLAKMGCGRITVYDPAEVAERDLHHEIYGPGDVGQPKVAALRQRIFDATGTKIRARQEKLDDNAELNGVVFMAVNDPEARQRIWESSVLFCYEVPLYVDMAASAKLGAVLALNPMESDHCDRYTRILSKSKGLCAPDTPGPLLDILSGLAAFRLIEHSRDDQTVTPHTKIIPPIPGELLATPLLSLDTPLHIIGLGAVGSYACMQAAKLGYRNITGWDFDKVENHNLPNQYFGPEDVGELKVEAIRRKVLSATGIEITAVPERFEGDDIEGALLMYVDSMKARKQIWERSAKGRSEVKLVVEARMGISDGRFYVLDPTNEAQCRRYEDTLYSDERAEESACTNRAIAPSTVALAGLTTLPFAFPDRRWSVNETFFQLMPWEAYENRW